MHGTLNDLAMMGAESGCLMVGQVLDAGRSFALLDRVLTGVARGAAAAGVPLGVGDPKVGGRGKSRTCVAAMAARDSRTTIGGRRIVDMLPGAQRPPIC